MSLVLTRIDNRLIHGQVLEAWVPNTKANCIVVANDRIAANPMQKLLMEASVPKGLRVFIGTVDEVNEILSSEELVHARVLLLFATANDALQAHRLGVEYDDLNLGNMHAGDGKVKCSCTIALAAEDVDDLNLLEKAGVTIYSQCVPSDKKTGWHKMLRLAKG